MVYIASQNFNAYQPKEVVEHAADCIVYINGVDSFHVCYGEGGKVKFTDALMSVSVNLSIESSPGTASISLAVPRHSQASYSKFGRCVFKNMMEVKIYFKGRYLDKEGRPIYYPAFWGVITNVETSYGGGEHTINISCDDILYFWAITRVSTNPSAFQQVWDNKLKLTEYVSVFNHLSPYHIIIALARICLGSLTPPQNFPKFGDGSSQLSFATFGEENKSAQDYWKQRQLTIGSRLRIFGAAPGDGNGSIKNTIVAMTEENMKKAEKYYIDTAGDPTKRKGSKEMESALSASETQFAEAFSLDGRLLEHFHPYNNGGQASDFSTGETMSRLELAQQVKEFIDYEFFMDVTGEIIFKPPFYNIDVRENDPISIIRDVDIHSDSISDSMKEIITRLDVKGTYSEYYADGNPNSVPFGSYVDYRMAREYGEKAQEVTRNFLHTSDMCTLYAIAELSRFNSKRFSGTLEIIGRPELRLGYPIYMEARDTFYYVTGISHTYSSSGILKTSLTIEGARRKYVSNDPDKKEGYSWDLDDPFRPRIKGVPNVVLTMDIPTSILEAGPVKPNQKTITTAHPGNSKDEAYRASALNRSPTGSRDSRSGAGGVVEDADRSQVTPPSKAKDPKPSATTNTPQTKPAKAGEDPKKDAGVTTGNEAKKETKNLADVAKPGNPKELVIPEKYIYRSPHLELIDRVMEGAAGIKFQTYGRPREIVQKGVYIADLRRIPVSDEFGYELIGGFGYGRGSKLKLDGTIGTYLPSSEAIKLSQESLDALKKNGVKDFASVIYRINGKPDLSITKKVIDGKETHDDVREDRVSYLLGVTAGEYRTRDVGKFLTEMGAELEHKIAPLDMKECRLAETDGALLESLDKEAFGLDANNALFNSEYYGRLGTDVPSTASYGGEITASILKDVSGKDTQSGIEGSVTGSGEGGSLVGAGTGVGSPVQIALAEMAKGVKEEPRGSNTGPVVNQYLKSVGLSPGPKSYWCAAFVFWCCEASSKSRGVSNPMIRSGYCPDIYTWAKNKNYIVKEPQPGDIFLVPCAKPYNAQHIGFVVNVSAGYITTCEGNASDKVSSIQRSKGSVYYVRVPFGPSGGAAPNETVGYKLPPPEKDTGKIL